MFIFILVGGKFRDLCVWLVINYCVVLERVLQFFEFMIVVILLINGFFFEVFENFENFFFFFNLFGFYWVYKLFQVMDEVLDDMIG